MKVKIFFLLSLILLLVACNESKPLSPGDGSEIPDQVITAPPIVQDQFTEILLNSEINNVSLNKSVSDPQGLSLTLKSVISKSEECPDPKFNKQDLTFFVDKTIPVTCYYEYTVENHTDNELNNKSASAGIYVLVGDQTSSLPPLSANTIVDIPVKINIVAEDGFALDPDVVVLGDGSAVADTVNSNITYTPTIKGVSRILYSLTSIDGLNVKAGTIDIAVSGIGNNMPFSENFTGPENVELATEITIDVADYISDPDFDPLQLTDVYAFNANVIVDNADDFNNTKFKFTAAEFGTYDVSYYVTDHRGGWTVGVVRIMVNGVSKPWSDIILDDSETYTAPWEKEGADAYRVPYQLLAPEDIDGETYNIALFDFASAQALCRARGMVLPSSQLLNKLVNGRPYIETTDFWPIGSNYWTDRFNQSYNIHTTDIASVNAAIPNAVTCVYPGKLSVDVIEDNAFTSTEIDSTFRDQIQATITGRDTTPIEGLPVYLFSTQPELSLEKTSQKTDANGQATFNVRSSIAGKFKATASYLSQQVDAELSFVNDSWGSGYLAISPDPITIKDNESKQLTAFAYTSAHPEGINVTNQVTWLVQSPEFATINETGYLNGVSIGTTSVTANYTLFGEEKQDSAPLNVITSRTYDSLEVSPSSHSMDFGATYNLVAKAHYSDGSVSAVDASAWSSNAPGVVAVASNGTITAKGVGTATVTATYAEEGVSHSNTSRITVGRVLTSVTVTPSSLSLDEGDKSRLSAIAHYNDGSSIDITNTADWSSSGGSVLAKDDGYIEAISIGNANVTASFQFFSASSHITVNGPRDKDFDGAKYSNDDNPDIPNSIKAVNILGGYQNWIRETTGKYPTVGEGYVTSETLTGYVTYTSDYNYVVLECSSGRYFIKAKTGCVVATEAEALDAYINYLSADVKAKIVAGSN